MFKIKILKNIAFTFKVFLNLKGGPSNIPIELSSLPVMIR